MKRLKEKLGANYIFMGQEEYEENRGYFDELSREGIVVVVSAGPDYKLNKESGVILMPKPLYAYPVLRILNDGYNAGELEPSENTVKPVFKNVRALIVDDEPMNLVVATSLFKEYGVRNMGYHIVVVDDEKISLTSARILLSEKGMRV